MEPEYFRYGKRTALLLLLMACVGSGSLLAAVFLSQHLELIYVVFIPAAFGFYAVAIYGFLGLIESIYKKDE